MSVSASSSLGRMPPHSDDAERGVLGCAIINSERVLDLAMVRGLRTRSFYYPANQAIWQAMLDLYDAGKAVDALTLSSRLRDLQVLEEVGGVEYLQSLVNFTPVAVHAEHYIDIVVEKAILRTIIDKSMEAADKCYDPDRDPRLILSETENAFMNLTEGGNETQRPWGDIMDGMMREITDAFDNRREVTGIPTGFIDLDRMLRGFQPSDMIVLAARPSMGKTSLALNIAENIAMGVGSQNGGKAVAVFSLEMSAEALSRRMICSRARVSAGEIGSRVRDNGAYRKLIDAALELKQAKIFIDDAAGLDVMEMRSRARRLKKKHDIQFIVVDYLQIARCEKYGRENWQREVGGISSEAKAMAKELKVPVLILSQLSRAVETRDRLGKPKLSDLRDSGSIEQDADVVLLLRRPAVYAEDPQSSDETLAIVNVAKHRNGATGNVELNFFGEFTRFDNREKHLQHPV